MALYAAKCYWPGITTDEFKVHAAERLVEIGTRAKPGPLYLGSMLFDEDALVLCFFDGRSPAAVRRAAEKVRVPCERVMHSVWLPDGAASIVRLGSSSDDPSPENHHGGS